MYKITPLSRWTIEHRLFRSVTRPEQGYRYLQVLALSHHPGRSYVAITRTNAASQTRVGTPASSQNGAESSSEPATIASIPPGAESEGFVQLISSKFGPIWTPRKALGVMSGLAFEVGEYCVRVAEVRQGSGSSQIIKGVVVEVEWRGGEEGDWEEAEVMIRAFWEGMGVKGAREVLQVAGLAKGDGSVRQWCEVLRLRT